MPIFNSQGDVAAGIGNNQVSINGKVIATGGCGGWVSDTLFVYGHGYMTRDESGADKEVWGFFQYDTTTGAIRQLGAGYNNICGGGGRRAGWNPNYGVFATGNGSNVDAPKAGLYGVAPDGTVAIVEDYQAGIGFQLIPPGEDHYPNDTPAYIAPNLVSVTEGYCFDLQPLSKTQAVWRDGNGAIHALGLPTPLQLGPANRPRAALVNGEWWITYWTEAIGLVAHPFDNFNGYLVQPDPVAFNHDAISVLGKLKICYSRTQGEGPNDITALTLDASSGRIDLRLARPSSIDVPRIARSIWVGFFTFQGSASRLPANCDLVVGDGMRVSSHGQAFCAYAAGTPEGDLSAIQTAVTRRKAETGLPVIAYCPRNIQRTQWPANADFIGLEAYWKTDETLAQFETEMAQAIRNAPVPVWIIAQAYTSNQSQQTDLLSLVPVYARLAKFDKVQGILVFSAGTRATGWDDHPEIHKAWQKLFDSVTTPELKLPEDKINPQISMTYGPDKGTAPLVVYATYSGTPGMKSVQWLYRKEGEWRWKVAANNPASDPDHHYLFDEVGTFEVACIGTWPTGTAQTGMTRRVVVLPAVAPLPEPPVAVDPEPDNQGPTDPGVPDKLPEPAGKPGKVRIGFWAWLKRVFTF